jgi:hypothetical protein
VEVAMEMPKRNGSAEEAVTLAITRAMKSIYGFQKGIQFCARDPGKVLRVLSDSLSLYPKG